MIQRIVPILLYGSELWGLDYIYDIRKVQLHACKRFISAPMKSCNTAILGDYGRYQMQSVSVEMCKILVKIVNMLDYRYVKRCCQMLLHYDSRGYSNLASKVKYYLYRNGLSYVWEKQGI